MANQPYDWDMSAKPAPTVAKEITPSGNSITVDVPKGLQDDLKIGHKLGVVVNWNIVADSRVNEILPNARSIVSCKIVDVNIVGDKCRVTIALDK